MMPGSKGLNPHELAHRWVKDLGTRPDMSIKVGYISHDMRILGRIVGVRSTEQSVGIIVGGFCPQHLKNTVTNKLTLIIKSYPLIVQNQQPSFLVFRVILNLFPQIKHFEEKLQ